MRTGWKMLLLAGSLALALAHGAPVTYSFTQTASGTINGVPFSNAQMVIRVTGDTSNVISGGGGHYELDYGANTAVLTISGVGTGTLSNSGAVIDNQQAFNGTIGIADSGLSWIAEVLDSTIGGTAFASYALNGPIGPSAVQPNNPANAIVNLPTSLGNLTVTSESNLFFQATGGAASVPALPPLAIFLLALLLAGAALALLGRLRRAAELHT